MNLNEISPTKTSLLEFKEQLQFSKDGHSLLEEKREVLVMHLMETISKMKENRERLDKLLMDSYIILKEMQVLLGELDVKKIIQGIKDISEVKVLEKTIMGVNIPSIKYRERMMPYNNPLLSFNSSDESYDMITQNIKEIINLIVIVAQTESAAWRLAYEIKKTQRRVNGLENVFIPEFKEIIKFIQETLEERERETFFQMKKIKNAKLER